MAEGYEDNLIRQEVQRKQETKYKASKERSPIDQQEVRIITIGIVIGQEHAMTMKTISIVL